MIKKLLAKYGDMIPYAIFGVLTTLVNIAAYWLLAHPLGLPTVPSTVIAWVLAVLFAYVTNRKWVFHSKAVTRQEIIREGISFYLCRLGTGVLDWLGMYVMVIAWWSVTFLLSNTFFDFGSEPGPFFPSALSAKSGATCGK